MEIKEKISFEEFLELEKRLDIRIGRVVFAERVPKSKKLIKLTVKFSEEPEEWHIKTIVTNLGEKFEPEQFVSKSFPFIMNLIPVVMMGIESQAMIMVGEIDGNIELNNYSAGAKLM